MAFTRTLYAASAGRSQSLATWWQRHERRVAPYLFIAPFYLVFVTIFLGPILAGFYISLNNWNGIGQMAFIGLGNYLNLAADQQVGMAVTNTIWYVGGAILILCPSSLGIASTLNHPMVRFRTFFRLIYFLPILTSVVVVALIFMVLYDRDVGLLNWFLSLVGIPPIFWLGTTWGKFSIVLLIVWRWAGYLSLFFLAGLQAVPRDLYESAEVDGANALQKFRHVTLPGLRPIIIFVGVIVLIGSSQTFEEPFILTNGGPQNTTLSYAMNLYLQGFSYLHFGYASALGFALFAVMFCASWIEIHVLGMFRED